MTDTREYINENKFVKYVQDDGGECVKIEKKGWPDRLILPPVPMGILWIEFKRRGFTSGKLQKHVHSILRGLGHVVAEADSYEKAVAIYEEYKRLYSSRISGQGDPETVRTAAERIISFTRLGKDDNIIDVVPDSQEEEDS